MPFTDTVSYEMNCYGYSNAGWWDTGEVIPADYSPENPELVFSYSATCEEYGCPIYEDYYLNYRHIDYCNLSGTADGESFTLDMFSLTPLPDCSDSGLPYDMYDGDNYYKYTDEYNACTEENGYSDDSCDQYLEVIPLSDMTLDDNGYPVERFCSAYYELPTDGFPTVGAFTDVPYSAYFGEAIKYLKDNGIVQGYEDGTFGILKGINRAEFVKILEESKGHYDYGDTEAELDSCTLATSFSDVPKTEWFYKYVCLAVKQGLVSGYPDGTFRPADNINFAEAAKILAMKFLVPTFNYAGYTGNTWYEPYVNALQEYKAIPLSVDEPERIITLGEMAEMIWRLTRFDL
jgi:hypothetical protein